jgi:hypothetical protein
MRRVVVDSCGVDPLVDVAGAYDAAGAAVDAGQLEILYTHVNTDELAATPDLERRCRLLLVLVALGRLVPTAAIPGQPSRTVRLRMSDARGGRGGGRTGRPADRRRRP